MRLFIGALLVRLGMRIIPRDAKEMARKIMLYHVPGVLTEDEKAEVRAAKRVWLWQAE
jgi:hypothetical protein